MLMSFFFLYIKCIATMNIVFENWSSPLGLLSSQTSCTLLMEQWKFKDVFINHTFSLKTSEYVHCRAARLPWTNVFWHIYFVIKYCKGIHVLPTWANIVLTNSISCPRCQRPRQHAIFELLKLRVVWFYTFFSYLFMQYIILSSYAYYTRHEVVN